MKDLKAVQDRGANMTEKDNDSIPSSSSKPDTAESSNGSSSILSNSTSGATFLILVQFLTKLLTFVLNQVLIRFISPRIFGISAYLEFLVSTVLFFSREGARLSIQRTESISEEKQNEDKNKGFQSTSLLGVNQSIINFGFIPFLLGVPLSLGIFYWQFHTSLFQDSILELPYHQATLLLVWSSILVELSIEPVYALNQFQLNFKRRSKFEGYAVFLRCIVTVSAIILSKRTQLSGFDGIAVLAFGLGQFTYSLMLAIQYYSSFLQDNKSKPSATRLVYYPQKIQTEGSYFYFNPKIVQIWKSLFIQMIFKQFLTEGDKLLINYLCTVEEQGVYSVITNYGSIVARLIFQPIEESVRLLFTRLLSTSGSKSSKEKGLMKDISDSYRVMKNLSIFYLNLSILIVLAGFTNASFILQILLGSRSVSKWASTNIFQVFPQYVIYIPFLAFNGILEAFFSSIATPQDIKKFSYFMTFSSGVVLASSYVFIEYFGLGLSGLILSNIINMILRISYCSGVIKGFFNSYNFPISVLSIVNHIKSAVIVGAVFEFVHYKFVLHDSWFTTNFKQFFASIFVCVGCLVSLLFIEKEVVLGQVRTILDRFKRKRD